MASKWLHDKQNKAHTYDTGCLYTPLILRLLIVIRWNNCIDMNNSVADITKKSTLISLAVSQRLLSEYLLQCGAINNEPIPHLCLEPKVNGHCHELGPVSI